jgi:hypothetical protein
MTFQNDIIFTILSWRVLTHPIFSHSLHDTQRNTQRREHTVQSCRPAALRSYSKSRSKANGLSIGRIINKIVFNILAVARLALVHASRPSCRNELLAQITCWLPKATIDERHKRALPVSRVLASCIHWAAFSHVLVPRGTLGHYAKAQPKRTVLQGRKMKARLGCRKPAAAVCFFEKNPTAGASLGA